MMYNRNSYYDGKQRYEIRNRETEEVIDGGFTSEKETRKRIKQLKQDMPGIKFLIWVYKDSERQ